MKKLLLLLMTLCLYISVSVGFAAEYPQENYEMYYEDNPRVRLVANYMGIVR